MKYVREFVYIVMILGQPYTIQYDHIVASSFTIPTLLKFEQMVGFEGWANNGLLQIFVTASNRPTSLMKNYKFSNTKKVKNRLLFLFRRIANVSYNQFSYKFEFSFWGHLPLSMAFLSP